MILHTSHNVKKKAFVAKWTNKLSKRYDIDECLSSKNPIPRAPIEIQSNTSSFIYVKYSSEKYNSFFCYAWLKFMKVKKLS